MRRELGGGEDRRDQRGKQIRKGKEWKGREGEEVERIKSRFNFTPTPLHWSSLFVP